MRTFRCHEAGLTVIELLIVLAILAITAGVLIPSVGGMIDHGKSEAHENEQKTIELAVTAFRADVHQGPLYMDDTWQWGSDNALAPGHYYPTENGRASKIEVNSGEYAKKDLLYVDDVVMNGKYDSGEEATDEEISSAAIWMGLLVNEGKDSGSDGTSDRTQARPKEVESDLYLADFPKSSSGGSRGNGNPAGTGGAYTWIVGQGGYVLSAYNQGGTWYAGYDSGFASSGGGGGGSSSPSILSTPTPTPAPTESPAPTLTPTPTPAVSPTPTPTPAPANVTEYILEIGSTTGGNVTEPGEGLFTYGNGTGVSIIAVPDEGWYFIGWSGNVTDIWSSNTTVIMDGNKTVNATFADNATTYYHLRFKYSTTSDWTTLDFSDKDIILGEWCFSTQGNITGIATDTVGHLEFSQPLSAAQVGERISMVMDFAISPDVIDKQVTLLIQKGALNESTLSIYNVDGDRLQLIQYIRHIGHVSGKTERNPKTFPLDLSALSAVKPQRILHTRIAEQKMLFAFYYPWYTEKNWGDFPLNDHPLIPYISSDAKVIERHIAQAQSVGIDGFISSWWEPHSYVDQNLKTLLDIAEQRDFRIAIYFETLNNGSARSADEIHDWLEYAIATYGDHPAYMKVDDKPVIVIWASESITIDTWKSIFTELRGEGLEADYIAMGYKTENLSVFDGVHEYGVFTLMGLRESFNKACRMTRSYQLLVDNSKPKIWAATAQPGYDDRLLPGRKGAYQDREGGEFYRGTFEAALASDPDWIFITSWNEWWENTQIEPSKLYSDQYLAITHAYADEWKLNK